MDHRRCTVASQPLSQREMGRLSPLASAPRAGRRPSASATAAGWTAARFPTPRPPPTDTPTGARSRRCAAAAGPPRNRQARRFARARGAPLGHDVVS